MAAYSEPSFRRTDRMAENVLSRLSMWYSMWLAMTPSKDSVSLFISYASNTSNEKFGPNPCRLIWGSLIIPSDRATTVTCH